MRRIILFITILLALQFGVKASKLSPSTEVSIITCAPGKEFYEIFGHTAIRIHDPVRQFDYAYNYGVFDFDRPDFYTNFAKGHLVYMLGVWDFMPFANSYAVDNRTVTEQVLNLTEDEKQAVYNYLENNSLPQNREYVYDYFYNNCSTKPRDVIEQALNGRLKFNYDFATASSYTTRQLVNQYADRNSWGDLGIDLALGAVIDRKMTPYQYMYLPEYLMKGLAKSTIDDSTAPRPLVKATNYLYKSHPEPPPAFDWTSPLPIFMAIFIIVSFFTVLNYLNGKRRYWIDAILFFVVGSVGCILTYISYFTNHHAGNNFNLLWAFPLHLVIGILLLVPKYRHWLRYYFAFSAGLILLVLLGWKLLPQDLNYTIIPLLATLLIRCVFIVRMETGKQLKRVLV